MLDIKYIRQNVDLIKAGAANKRIDCDIDRLCAVDDRRKAIQAEVDRRWESLLAKEALSQAGSKV
jgi:seryl-tRNA synthetase